MADDRFQVAVGGNPLVVESMIERAQVLHSELTRPADVFEIAEKPNMGAAAGVKGARS